MNAAVFTLTRDRLEYTQHCFARLTENAGCEYDHYVLDQGSTDGTPDWLMGQKLRHVSLLDENVGINAGMNQLLEAAIPRGYDVIVKMDNDCELREPGTVRVCAELALEGNAILSPRILGLQNTPAAQGHFQIGDELIIDIPQIGGIFMAVPASLFDGFRYDERRLLFDDVDLCWWFRRERGGRCGYVSSLEAWHYETTDGQRARYPTYFARKMKEYAEQR